MWAVMECTTLPVEQSDGSSLLDYEHVYTCVCVRVCMCLCETSPDTVSWNRMYLSSWPVTTIGSVGWAVTLLIWVLGVPSVQKAVNIQYKHVVHGQLYRSQIRILFKGK